VKADRIGALVTALPFAVAGALLFAGWLWASQPRTPKVPAKPREASTIPASGRNDAGHAEADKHSR
jgi:hypothetical protein